MSWASRRRAVIITGLLFLFFGGVSIPLAMWIYEPPTCFDGVQNQGETSSDRGGPCILLDDRTLVPHAVLWSRGFPVRDGTWSAVAYVENPNEGAGVREVPYRYKLYDDKNILVAEREGVTYIMPGSVTPIYEGGIDTGHRNVARAYFEFMAPLVWERVRGTADKIEISGKTLSDPDSAPRVTAVAENTDVADVRNAQFVAVIFDSGGNAMAASRTVVSLLPAGGRESLTFTWPDPLPRSPGRIDVIPLREPDLLESRRNFF
jgi:hypothetical protein